MHIIIVFVAIAIVVIDALVIVFYYNHYTRMINKRLKEQVSNRRKVWAPATVAIITVFTGLVLFSITFSLVEIHSPCFDIDDHYHQAQYDYEVYAPEDRQQGYLSKFSISENAGYSKYVEITDDIKYTYFISNEEYDIFHPFFIIFVEYVGTSDIISYGIQGDFINDTNDLIYQNSFSGVDVSNYVFIVGNASVDCVFQFSLYYYDEEGTVALLQDETNMNNNNELYSIANSTINIEISMSQE